MKFFITFFVAFLCICGLLCASPVQAQAQLLEKYYFQHGLGSDFVTRDAELTFTDRSLGNTDINFRLNYTISYPGKAHVKMEVFRYNPPQVASGGIIIERIDLLFLNSAGKAVRTVVVDNPEGGAVYGLSNSSSGYFEHSLSVDGLTKVHALMIRIWGDRL